jgi:DNA-binding XRE family transcriptional regulator
MTKPEAHMAAKPAKNDSPDTEELRTTMSGTAPDIGTADYTVQDYQDASTAGNQLITTFLATPGNLERAQETSNRLLQKATLANIRRSRSLTQTQIAQALGVSQSRVVEIEHQQDLQLSTLTRYAQATGGTITIEITYPDGTRLQLHKEASTNFASPTVPSRTRRQQVD